MGHVQFVSQINNSYFKYFYRNNMPRETFDINTRCAIWDAYDRKCFYCNQYIEYDGLEIDHIIPLSLEEDGIVLSDIRKRYYLPDDFDINDFSNLVPTHNKCNSRKTNLEFEVNTILYYRELTKNKIDKIKDNITKINTQKKIDTLLSSLQINLAAENITTEQVLKILSTLNNNNIDVSLLNALEFSNKIIKKYIQQCDVDKLMYEPILEEPDSLTLRNDENDTVNVFSCLEWAEYKRRGYYPNCNYCIKTETYFKVVYACLIATKNANHARYNYIDNVGIGIKDVDKWSLRLLPILSYDCVNKINNYSSKGISVSDLIKKKKVKIIEKTDYSVTIKYDHVIRTVWEMMHADFNGDGYQDLLVKYYQHFDSGTYGYGDVLLLTRKSNESLFEEVTDFSVEV